ncbi:hypothetical protein F7725_001703 [Dissostichus mawsoni]|uniref:Tomoregulin-2 n=1 Tax=Dissostichus mawsoni TaxID=36200 RepID=A0A7J5Y0C6_DISMA|nr:hypothetical protein F7725_001703 [Dissostichus mawsoni]
MGLSVAAQAPLSEPRRPRQWSGTAGGWLRITLVSFLATLPVEQLRAFPSSLSDCQTPTGWNCSGFDDRDTDLFLCDTNTCKFDGECLRIGNMVTCICDFKCNNDYAPVCGSNNQNYQNECFLRRDACKQQSEVLIMSEGACPADAGSGSGDDARRRILLEWKSSIPPKASLWLKDLMMYLNLEKIKYNLRGSSKLFESEKMAQLKRRRRKRPPAIFVSLGLNAMCVCNIDCSHISFNQVCASDGRSYDNPCQVKEASCQKQERIEVKHLGDAKEKDPRNGLAIGLYIPCPDHFKNYCVHGECQFPSIVAQPSCSCHSGFRGPQCDIKEYNVLYVVPGSGKLHYVLIASIIGALQEVPADQQDQPAEAEQCPLQYGEHHARLHPAHLSPHTPDRAPPLRFTGSAVALDVPPPLLVGSASPSPPLPSPPNVNSNEARGGRWCCRDSDETTPPPTHTHTDADVSSCTFRPGFLKRTEP